MRIHYQRVSADARSLVNIDQDFINDIQLTIPVSSIKPIYNIPLSVEDEELRKLTEKFARQATDPKRSENIPTNTRSSDEEEDEADFFDDEL